MFKDYLITPGLSPPWLLGPTGTAKLQTIGSTIDQLTGEGTGKSTLAMQADWPTKADPTALPFIGQDTLVMQGPAETTAAYRLRLRSAYDTWRSFAGNDWGILLQVLSQFGGLNGITVTPRVRCVNNSGVWRWFDAGADSTQPPSFAVKQWNWDATNPPGSPDGNFSGLAQLQAYWWRFWVSVESTGSSAFATQWPTLGTGGQPTLGSVANASLGFSNVNPSFWSSLRKILDTWKSRHAVLKYILVTFNSSLINPGSGPGGGINPDGTWGYGYKIASGVYGATWIASVLPVPGPVGMPPDGPPNNLAVPVFGYRISGGTYAAL